jgi:hypothetical protein
MDEVHRSGGSCHSTTRRVMLRACNDVPLQRSSIDDNALPCTMCLKQVFGLLL